jgi:hypothetical protein
MRRIAGAAALVVVGMCFLSAAVGACVGTDAASTVDPGANDAGGDTGAGATSDGGTDASAADVFVPDAAIDAPPPRCDINKPFGASLPVDGVSTGLDEQGISLSPDELTAYFSRDGNGSNGQDLLVGKRGKIGDPFTSVILDGYDNSNVDYEPSVSSNELTLIFWSIRVGSTTPDLYQATRTNKTLSFDPAALIVALQTGAVEGTPGLRPDGKILYYGANPDSATKGFDIYRAARQGDGTFLGPTIAQQNLLVNVNSAFDELHPVISDDELTIYFSSTRTDLTNMGGQDIFVARRLDTAQPFGTPKNVSELNSVDEEAPNWVSPDGCAIYLTAKHTGGGGTDIYVARRPL